MNLLEIYKEKNKSKKWRLDHFSLGMGSHGNMFEYVNTNFRTQTSFQNQFVKFLPRDGVSREEWPKQDSYEQELDKHRVVRMLQSKLFKRVGEKRYNVTEKGATYNEFIKNDSFSEEERWLINYLFLLNGYYSNRKNYIVKRVEKDLLNYFLPIEEVDEDYLINSAKQALNKKREFSSLVHADFFFLHSFYNDADFLINYLRASREEKEKLIRYIEKNINNESYNCCISHKYQPGGNFTPSMFLDEVKVFLLTLLFIKDKTEVGLKDAYKFFIKKYNKNIASIDKEKVLNYFTTHDEIFDSIIIEILELEQEEDVVIPSIIKEKEDEPQDYIDETTKKGKRKIQRIYKRKKRAVYQQSNFKCELEEINNCEPIYFTSKTTKENYLEIHHLIPKEFRNNFSYSIEVLANYVSLCPRCHKQIHFATDRERRHLINSLYEKRKERLDKLNLTVKREELYDYYKID